MFLKKPKKQLVAVFDIGSASVGGLLFYKREDKKPEILTSARQLVDYSDKKQFPLAWKAMRNALDLVAKNIQNGISQKPNMAFCVFSAPWYVPQIKVIKVKKENPFEITSALLKEIIEDEADIFEHHWQSSTDNKKDFFLEKQLLKTSLNGYEVPKIIGKYARHLELHTYLSLSMKPLEEKITENVLNYTQDRHIFMHSFPFVLFNVLKNILDTKEGMVVVDISGEITDVIIIRDNTIKEISSFPKGENFFLRRLAGALNIEPDEARSIFLQYKRGELNKASLPKIKHILGVAGEEWGHSFKELLKKGAEDKFIPSNLYFCGQAGRLKEVYEQISGPSFSDFTILGNPFSVNFLLSKSLKYYFDFKREPSDREDIFLLVSSLFANHFIKKI
ncbi:hypothetical protein KKA27_00975 [Patescibacteria group bacterium]|nr:hypothetical protein [Patescibacteria group bacterium]MBU2632989.1 hypothetical protein [Patescibacteria group bacterium]